VAPPAALALALCSLLLGLVPWQAYLPVPAGVASTPTVLQALSSSLWPLLAGGALAILLGRWDDRFARIPLGKAAAATVSAVRCAALVFGNWIVRIDGVLRQWPAAGLCMLVLAIAFAAAMLAAR
jgi:multicomponent Na+:H+ antiporter subunit D